MPTTQYGHPTFGMIALACVLLAISAYDLIVGRATVLRWFQVSREGQPGLFWSVVAMQILLGLAGLVLAAGLIR